MFILYQALATVILVNRNNSLLVLIILWDLSTIRKIQNIQSAFYFKVKDPKNGFIIDELQTFIITFMSIINSYCIRSVIANSMYLTVVS